MLISPLITDNLLYSTILILLSVYSPFSSCDRLNSCLLNSSLVLLSFMEIRFRYYSPFVTGHIYSLQTYGITFTRFLSFLCLSVHTSPKYFIVSFSTSSFTSTYPFITPIVLSFSSSTSHVLSHLLPTMS